MKSHVLAIPTFTSSIGLRCKLRSDRPLARQLRNPRLPSDYIPILDMNSTYLLPSTTPRSFNVVLENGPIIDDLPIEICNCPLRRVSLPKGMMLIGFVATVDRATNLQPRSIIISKSRLLGGSFHLYSKWLIFGEYPLPLWCGHENKLNGHI